MSLQQLDAVIRQSRRLKKGEYLFRTGEPFASLFAIRAGFSKPRLPARTVAIRLPAFYVRRTHRHGRHLLPCPQLRRGGFEDSEVCELPFTHIEELGHNIPSLRSHFSD